MVHGLGGNGCLFNHAILWEDAMSVWVQLFLLGRRGNEVLELAMTIYGLIGLVSERRLEHVHESALLHLRL